VTDNNTKNQLSNAERQRIIYKFQTGKSIKTISEELELSNKTVFKTVKIFRETGRILKSTLRCHPQKVLVNKIHS
jgi:transposase